VQGAAVAIAIVICSVVIGWVAIAISAVGELAIWVGGGAHTYGASLFPWALTAAGLLQLVLGVQTGSLLLRSRFPRGRRGFDLFALALLWIFAALLLWDDAPFWPLGVAAGIVAVAIGRYAPEPWLHWVPYAWLTLVVAVAISAVYGATIPAMVLWFSASVLATGLAGWATLSVRELSSALPAE